MATQDAARKAYRFFRERSFSQEPFAYEDLAKETGWSNETAKDYVGKQWRDVVTRKRSGRVTELKVKPEFRRLSEERFLALASQTRDLFVKYDRTKYERIIEYEFLLPLTHESELRKALDDLFYEDAIRQRLLEIGLNRVETWIRRHESETDDNYMSRVCVLVSTKFGGYSISHVNGRYLADTLTSRADAAKMLANEQRYIIDETTASVRFIVPFETSKQDILEDFEEVDDSTEHRSSEGQVEEERLVRALFFNVFAEAVVRSVEGEDAIWLVEESPSGRKLYVWRKSKSNTDKTET